MTLLSLSTDLTDYDCVTCGLANEIIMYTNEKEAYTFLDCVPMSNYPSEVAKVLISAVCTASSRGKLQLLQILTRLH